MSKEFALGMLKEEITCRESWIEQTNKSIANLRLRITHEETDIRQYQTQLDSLKELLNAGKNKSEEGG